MKTIIGGDRLGSGNKENLSLRNYERSTHDLSYLWRSSMSVGTLVPFMNEVALPGDTFDINLNTEVLTLPTIGPLFGSCKVQLDIFKIPIRLYQAKLHQNALGIGMQMSSIKLPTINLGINPNEEFNFNKANEQINTSCLLRYLGISGIGTIDEEANSQQEYVRSFNAVSFLAYWDIYKNYYANKQEEEAYVIHTSPEQNQEDLTPINAYVKGRRIDNGIIETINIFGSNGTFYPSQYSVINLYVEFGEGAPEPSLESVYIEDFANDGIVALNEIFNENGQIYWSNNPLPNWISSGQSSQSIPDNTLVCSFESFIYQYNINQAQEWEIQQQLANASGNADGVIRLKGFPLKNIDTMREKILGDVANNASFIVGEGDNNIEPYNLVLKDWGNQDDVKRSRKFSQEGLGIKTYQSDIFNNFIDTEFIDGENGVNSIAKVSTEGNEFTIDALNLTMKVYKMLNRIAVSGGSYDDWLDATYTHERKRGVQNPVYMGGLIKELAFEEVISNAETNEHPLGTLAGRGRLTQKNKGGKVIVKCDEPSYIMGIVSITPRIDYSQGNRWDIHLKTLDDLHKPALDGIGFQELITEQMLYSDTVIMDDGSIIQKSIGKQPAWLNYMTNYNRCYGNFADPNKEMFMTFNRRYEAHEENETGVHRKGELKDGTTYIDPVKYNQIFAETNLDSQNYWVQISSKITARRKMSAKVIPNL